MKTKLVKRLLGFIVVFILITFTLNAIIFNLSQAPKYKDANWGGKWSSSTYFMIGGKILANFPDEIPINKEFDVDLLVYYNIWGLYRMGQASEFTLSGLIEENNSTAGEGGNIDHSSSSTAKLNFKAKLFNSIGQILEYSGESNKMKTNISGTYKSLIPEDYGRFKIKKL